MNFIRPRNKSHHWAEATEDIGHDSERNGVITAPQGSPSLLLSGFQCQGDSQQNSHIQGKSENKRGQGKPWREE